MTEPPAADQDAGQEPPPAPPPPVTPPAPAPVPAPSAPRLTDEKRWGVVLAAIVGVVLIAVYVITVLILIDEALTDSPTGIGWQRAMNLLLSLETIALVAVAFVFGREVNRSQTVAAQALADQAIATGAQADHNYRAQVKQTEALDAKSKIEERRAEEAARNAKLAEEKGRLLADAVRSSRGPYIGTLGLTHDIRTIEALDTGETRVRALRPDEARDIFGAGDDPLIALADRLFPPSED